MSSDKAFRMPDVWVGLTVLWFAGRLDGQGQAALVTAVGDEAIDVSVFIPAAITQLPRNGVRHVSDPAWKWPEKCREGFWDYVREPSADPAKKGKK